MEKRCFKCAEIKPRSEFYAHPRMADGLLGKCKDCTKEDSEARRVQKERDPVWRAAELERHRAKSAMARLAGSVRKPTTVQRRVYTRKHRAKHPLADKARALVNREVRAGRIQREPCEVPGCERRASAHHDDYSKPLEVRWLCPEHHAAWHVAQRRESMLGKAA